MIVRESLPTLKRTTLVTFHKILEEGLSPFVQKFNRETNVVSFENGSELIFMPESYDQDKDFNRFRGLEVNGGAIDEINEVQEDTFNKIIERSGSWNGAIGNPPICILATCNPASNWVKDKFYIPWKEDKLPESWAYIPAKITDNPFIEKSYLDSLKQNMPPLDYAKFVEGDWDVIQTNNQFAYQYDIEKHEGLVTYDPSKVLYISIDFNLNPFGVIFAHIFRDKDGDHCHVFDELLIENGSIQEMIDQIKSRYFKSLPTCQITGDAMGNQRQLSQRDNASFYIQLQRGLGLRTSQIKAKSNPTHENSRADVNYVLFNYPDFKINPKTCPNTALDMKVVQCDAFGSIMKKNRKDLSQRADFLDDIRYLTSSFLSDWIKRHQKQYDIPIAHQRARFNTSKLLMT